MQSKSYSKVRLQQSYSDLQGPMSCAIYTNPVMCLSDISYNSLHSICTSHPGCLVAPRIAQVYACLRAFALTILYLKHSFSDICILFFSSLRPLLQSHLFSEAFPGYNYTKYIHIPDFLPFLSSGFIFLSSIPVPN